MMRTVEGRRRARERQNPEERKKRVRESVVLLASGRGCEARWMGVGLKGWI